MSGRPINALELFGRMLQPVKERASVLPLAQYEDGRVGLAVPGVVQMGIDGFRDFGKYGFDTEEANAFNAGKAFDAAGLAVTGGLGVGLAGGLADDAVRAAPRMADSVSAPSNLSADIAQKRAGLLETIRYEEQRAQQLLAGKEGWQRAYGKQALERVSALRNRVADMESGRYVEPKPAQILDEEEFFQPPPFDPLNARAPTQTPNGFLAYRGVQNADQMVNGPIKDVKPQHFAWWGTADPEVAGLFAGQGDRAATIPAEVRFKNPLEVDAQGSDWRIPKGNGFSLTDEIVDAARRGGNDGVIFKNIREGNQGEYPLSTTFAAIRPGTVYSATTGNLLYSNAPTGSSVPLAVNALERSNVRAPSGPWPETAGFDDRLAAVRQTFDNPNDLYQLPLPFNKATREDRLPYNHSDLIDGKEAITKEVQLRDLLSFQNNARRDDVRALTNPDVRAGAGEPTVVRYRGNDQIVDGHHRLLADLLNGNDAATVRYIDSLLANHPTAASIPLAGEAQDTDPIASYLRLLGIQ